MTEEQFTDNQGNIITKKVSDQRHGVGKGMPQSFFSPLCLAALLLLAAQGPMQGPYGPLSAVTAMALPQADPVLGAEAARCVEGGTVPRG